MGCAVLVLPTRNVRASISRCWLWGILVVAGIASDGLAAAELQISTGQVSFSAKADGPPQVATLQLTTADPSYGWTAQADVPWLEFAPASGRGSQSIKLRASPENLQPGHYSARVIFIPNRFPGSPQVLQVSYTLQSESGVQVYAGNHQNAIIEALFPAPMVVQVADDNGDPLQGVTVRFVTVVGDTEPAQASVVTDASGRASFQPKALDYGAIGVAASTDLEAGFPVYFSASASGWISTFAGDGIRAWGGDGGPASQAQLNAPFGMAFVDKQLLVVDYFNHALRGIDLDSGVIQPLVGNGKQGFNGDGLDALATVLSGPFGIALGPDESVVFSDYYNNRIRAIERVSGKVTTLAGTGTVGYSGDGGPGPQAEIDVPLDIAADSRGNVYLSDWHHHVVRRIDAETGRIETIAGIGKPGYTGEGDPRAVALATPLGLSVDQHDNVYIADYGNNRVRKIDAQTGLISTVAGTGKMGFSGDGDLAVFAQLNRPYNVFVDQNGGLFISDAGNHRVRHVDQVSGVITTIAGQGQFGYSGDKDLAVNEMLEGPFSLIRDDGNNLYIAEYFGHRIRKIGATKASPAPVMLQADLLMRQSRQIFGQLPGQALSAENPLSDAKVALGKALFHEPRLSADGTISCSSCHSLDTFGADGLRVARGINGQLGERNSPSVFNAALQDSQFWDGRADTVESQARVPLLDPREMAMPDEAAVVAAVAAAPEYRSLFAAAFPDDAQPVTFGHITDALGAFQRTLLTPNSPFDRFLAGQEDALSPQQQLGLSVFLREGCASCHGGPLLGGQDLHLIADYPNTAAGVRLELRKHLGNTDKFKIAPLRNIVETAPYLHDGRDADLAANLGARLDAYVVSEAGIRDTVDMSSRERAALLAFLGALTGEVDPDLIAVKLPERQITVKQ
jgi:cytochrome c peroxidase